MTMPHLYTIEYKTPLETTSISTIQMTIQKMIDSFQIIDSQQTEQIKNNG